jgi:cation diffusion facilitator family transporter
MSEQVRALSMRSFCICYGRAVVDVLQGSFSSMLAVMGEHGHGRIRHGLRPHSHQAADKVDAALEASAAGLRALWISLAVLAATAGLQAVVVVVSGSVALLGDTLHNAADALTAVPLGVAFLLGRRPPSRRYTYGYGRAEDLAGVVIVLVIAASSALAGYAAVTRLAQPRPVSHLIAVAGAALIGFTGNEVVARYRIRVGRQIGSAALVADGLHARTDGFTSLAVLLGVGGVAVGWDWADPVVGLLITVAILAVLRQAAREVYRRLMDAVDPALLDQAEQVLRATPGVLDLGQVRLRWIGHQLRAECEIVVDTSATLIEAHKVAVSAEHALLHALPRLTAALVHADPPPDAGDHHAVLAPHR